MRTAVTADTNCGMGGMAINGLYLVPMPVIINGNIFHEGVDITNQELYAAMQRHENITTSQPSPGEIAAVWDKVFEDGYDEIVHIPMSCTLSGSYAGSAALSGEYGGRVHVADCRRLSVTQEESVRAALRMVGEGKTAAEIKETVERCAYDMNIFLAVDTLEYLRKGGRIGPAIGAIATILNIKPVLSFAGNEIVSLGKVRGMRHALEALIENLKKERAGRFAKYSDDEIKLFAAGTFVSAEQTDNWKKMIADAFPGANIEYCELPCGIAVHTGPNAAGIAISLITR